MHGESSHIYGHVLISTCIGLKSTQTVSLSTCMFSHPRTLWVSLTGWCNVSQPVGQDPTWGKLLLITWNNLVQIPYCGAMHIRTFTETLVLLADVDWVKRMCVVRDANKLALVQKKVGNHLSLALSPTWGWRNNTAQRASSYNCNYRVSKTPC